MAESVWGFVQVTVQATIQRLAYAVPYLYFICVGIPVFCAGCVIVAVTAWEDLRKAMQ